MCGPFENDRVLGLSPSVKVEIVHVVSLVLLVLWLSMALLDP